LTNTATNVRPAAPPTEAAWRRVVDGPSGLPLVVQLLNGDTSACFESRFEAADVTTNSSRLFKAKAR
jgi:hypothetical protein